jgi:hypothetical protein
MIVFQKGSMRGELPAMICGYSDASSRPRDPDALSCEAGHPVKIAERARRLRSANLRRRVDCFGLPRHLMIRSDAAIVGFN